MVAEAQAELDRRRRDIAIIVRDEGGAIIQVLQRLHWRPPQDEGLRARHRA